MLTCVYTQRHTNNLQYRIYKGCWIVMILLMIISIDVSQLNLINNQWRYSNVFHSSFVFFSLFLNIWFFFFFFFICFNKTDFCFDFLLTLFCYLFRWTDASNNILLYTTGNKPWLSLYILRIQLRKGIVWTQLVSKYSIINYNTFVWVVFGEWSSYRINII